MWFFPMFLKLEFWISICIWHLKKWIYLKMENSSFLWNIHVYIKELYWLYFILLVSYTFIFTQLLIQLLHWALEKVKRHTLNIIIKMLKSFQMESSFYFFLHLSKFSRDFFSTYLPSTYHHRKIQFSFYITAK